MDAPSQESGSRLNDKGVAVALITLARFLSDRNPDFPAYLHGSLRHAEASHLAQSDLTVLRLLIRSVGG